MQLTRTTMTQKGQVTIPRDIRNSLGLKPHDKVEFVLEGDHAVIRRAQSRLWAGYGSVTPLTRPEDFHAIREMVEQGIADEVMAETPINSDLKR